MFDVKSFGIFRAFLYLGTSNWKEAHKYFEKVVTIDPNNIEVIFDLFN